MNEELNQLYDKYWDDFEVNIRMNPNVQSAYPYLIYVPERYEKASLKVMFCGQETQGWGGEYYDCEHVTVDNIRGVYNGFVNEAEGYNSPFWNLQRQVTRHFSSVGFIRNNIVKIGKRHNPGCDEEIYKLEKQYFPVFKDELRILNPDLVIILSSGVAYDNKLRELLGEFKVENLSDNMLFERLVFVDDKLPQFIRIKHPRRVQQEGNYWAAVDHLREYIEKFIH